jgi:hypothetical protein
MSKLPGASIPPGGEAEIVVESKIAKQSGPFAHSATVGTNDPDTPALTLRISGMVCVRLGARPRRLHFADLKQGAAQTASTVIYSEVFDGFAISDVRCSLPGATWEIEPADPARLSALKARSGYQLAVRVPVSMNPSANDGRTI